MPPRARRLPVPQAEARRQGQLAYEPEGNRTYKLKLREIELAAIEAKAGAKQGMPASLSALDSGR